MDRIIAFLVILSMNFAIQTFPIENGFSPKEELRPRKFGKLFAKIPQEFKDPENIRRKEVLNTVLLPQDVEVPSGYSNEVIKSLFLNNYGYNRKTNNITISLAKHWSGLKYLNLPIFRQPYDDYKVLVATAPPNVNLGGDNKQVFIYVVFPEDGSSNTRVCNVPIVYFVSGNTRKPNAPKKEPVDPILIVDSNRTVTGIKSKEVAKFVRFKNKLSKHSDHYKSR